MKIENIRIQVTMTSLSGKEWVSVLKDDSDFKKQFGWDYVSTLDFISYVDQNCGGWEQYVRRVYNYGKGYDFIKEMYYYGGIGRDKIFGFVSDHKDSFSLWMRYQDKYIWEVLKEHNRKLMDFKDSWFVEEDDMFILFCCKFIGSITKKLLKFADVEYILNK